MGLACLALYLGLLAFLYLRDRPLFEEMVRLYALTLAAGREPAMFAVYQPPTPVPLHWMLLIAVLDDVGTLLLTLPWVWYVFHRLHGVGAFQNWLLGLEKSALENRRWIQRGGLAGLAAFYWLPGFGSGVLAICVMGVLAHIRLRRLVPTLVTSAALVAAFWAVVLSHTSALLPRGPVENLPFAVLALVLTLSLLAALRNRRTAHILLLDWPEPTPARAAALGPLGIVAHKGVVAVDSKRLAAHLGQRDLGRGRAHAIAELLLVEGVTPPAAQVLERAGVGGIVDLAALDIGLVREALQDAGDPSEDEAPRWVERARQLAREADAVWRRR